MNIQYVATVGMVTKTFSEYSEAVNFIRRYWFGGLLWKLIKIENNRIIAGY